MSDEREKELDDLNKELREAGRPGPHIEHPEEKNVPPNGLCWLNVHRYCGPDCVAFGDASAPEPAQRCTVLAIGSGILVQLKLPPQYLTTAMGTVYPPPDPLGKKP